jgi:pSer/pThr/pTyr-binding forkhead associated (FHA) protein
VSQNQAFGGIPIPDVQTTGPGPSEALLRCTNGKAPGQTYLLKAPSVTFGRNDPVGGTSVTHDLAVQEEGETRQWVSRSHAECALLPDGWHIADLGSRNGTFLNDARLEPGKPRPLRHGDVVRFGKLAFQVEMPS